jgi:hypothetical protein
MKHLFDRLVVCAYVAVAVLPAVGLYTRFDDRPIDGVLVDKRRPKLTAKAFLTERYQHDFAAWFENRIGFKGYSVRVDNTLLYHLFDETKFGANVVLGEDGVLYERDDLEYFGKYGPYLPSAATADAFARKVAAIQAWYRARHRDFIPVVIPSKTSVYRAEVPASWRRLVGSPPPTDEHVYRLLLRALDAHGVRYVDARAMIERSTEPRPKLWGIDARHWSSFAACLAMQEVVKLYAESSGRAMPDHPCATTLRVVEPNHVDHDLARLVNAWGVDEAAEVPVVEPLGQARDISGAPTLLITGCSFSWALLRDAHRAGEFRRLEMNYYNQTFVPWPEDIHKPVEPYSAYWNETVLDKDLVILDLTETYAFAEGGYSEVFVDQIAKALGI